MNVIAEAAVAILIKGWTPKAIKSTAETVSQTPEWVETNLRKVIAVYDKAIGSKVTSDFTLFSEICALNDLSLEEATSIFDIYKNYAETLKVILQNSDCLPHYKSVEWRLDVKVASRTCLEQMEPQVMMKLHLDSPPEVCVKKLNRTEDCSADEEAEQILEPLRNNDVMLQTDPSNLVHMCSVLEDALNQIKTSHVRRHIKNL